MFDIKPLFALQKFNIFLFIRFYYGIVYYYFLFLIKGNIFWRCTVNRCMLVFCLEFRHVSTVVYHNIVFLGFFFFRFLLFLFFLLTSYSLLSFFNQSLFSILKKVEKIVNRKHQTNKVKDNVACTVHLSSKISDSRLKQEEGPRQSQRQNDVNDVAKNHIPFLFADDDPQRIVLSAEREQPVQEQNESNISSQKHEDNWIACRNIWRHSKEYSSICIGSFIAVGSKVDFYSKNC